MVDDIQRKYMKNGVLCDKNITCISLKIAILYFGIIPWAHTDIFKYCPGQWDYQKLGRTRLIWEKTKHIGWIK